MFSFFKKIAAWFGRLFGAPATKPEIPWKTRFVDSDELPSEIFDHELVVAKEGDTLWSAGLKCPCNCGRRLELMLLKEVSPRWDVAVDNFGRPSLHPSVWVADGCKSHFWLKDGAVRWC